MYNEYNYDYYMANNYKMKETKIAKENVETAMQMLPMEVRWIDMCKEHKQTCQRWLEFMGKIYCQCGACENIIPKSDLTERKIVDLKQAIKIYDDAGV